MIVLSLRSKGYAVKLLLTGLASLWLAVGCRPYSPLQQDWYDYQQRLAKPQQLESQPWQLQPPPQLPALRELRLDVPTINLSLLDSLRLEHCKVAALIAERNSSLGRLQQGVLRYYHDVQMSSALQDCVSTLTDTELRQRLSTVAREKRANLPQLRALALLQDQALRNTLDSGKWGLSDPESAQFAPLLQALEIVLQTLTSDSADDLPDLAELQKALEILDKSSYSSELWRGFDEQRQILEQLDPLLQGIDQRAGCLSAGVPERAQILRNVAIHVFAGELQPRLALYFQQGQAVKPYLERLHALNSHPLMNDHLAQLIAQPDQLRSAVRHHAQLWQKLFNACGFSPQQERHN